MFPQIFGKYVLERQIAAGGMAVVYLATLRGAGGFEKRLIVKQIRAELASDEAFVRRFVEEAKTTVELSHPNIVPVYELGVEQGVYYIAMEWAEGLTLAELIKAGGKVSAEEGAYLGVEICRALDYAYRRAGIVHRDVTPRNVLIDEEGAVRLIDFGIAAPATEDGASRREKVFGSPGHMPPEQIRGGRLTPATDVFAVAALLIEAWTGEAPFRRGTRQESDAALAVAPDPLSETDTALEPLDALIARSVAADQSDRPQTAEELARPLREFLRSSDLGDIARRLGARVRAGRKVPDDVDATPAYATPHTRPLADAASSGSRTFAAGERLVEWTRGISTRPPPPEDDGASTPVAVIPRLEPVLVDPEGAGQEHGAAVEERKGEARPASGAGNVRPEDAGSAPGRRGARTWVRLFGAVALVAGGWWLFARQPPGEDRIIGAPGAGVGMPPSSASPAAPVPPAAGSGAGRRGEPVHEGPGGNGAPAATHEGAQPAAVALRAGRRSSVLAPPPARSGVQPEADAAREGPTAAVGRTELTLTADLPARVVVDGRTLGTTPVRTAWPSGVAQVIFQSVELNERLQTTVELLPRTPVGLHAEFRRAHPAVRRR